MLLNRSLCNFNFLTVFNCLKTVLKDLIVKKKKKNSQTYGSIPILLKCNLSRSVSSQTQFLKSFCLG